LSPFTSHFLSPPPFFCHPSLVYLFLFSTRDPRWSFPPWYPFRLLHPPIDFQITSSQPLWRILYPHPPPAPTPFFSRRVPSYFVPPPFISALLFSHTPTSVFLVVDYVRFFLISSVSIFLFHLLSPCVSVPPYFLQSAPCDAHNPHGSRSPWRVPP